MIISHQEKHSTELILNTKNIFIKQEKKRIKTFIEHLLYASSQGLFQPGGMYAMTVLKIPNTPLWAKVFMYLHMWFVYTHTCVHMHASH